MSSEQLRQQLAAAKQQLARYEDLLRMIVDHTRDYAFIVFDTENRVRGWNTGAERMFGYTEEEILGSSGATFFVPEDVAAGTVQHELTDATRQGTARDDRWLLR